MQAKPRKSSFSKFSVLPGINAELNSDNNDKNNRKLTKEQNDEIKRYIDLSQKVPKLKLPVKRQSTAPEEQSAQQASFVDGSRSVAHARLRHALLSSRQSTGIAENGAFHSAEAPTTNEDHSGNTIEPRETPNVQTEQQQQQPEYHLVVRLPEGLRVELKVHPMRYTLRQLYRRAAMNDTSGGGGDTEFTDNTDELECIDASNLKKPMLIDSKSAVGWDQTLAELKLVDRSLLIFQYACE